MYKIEAITSNCRVELLSCGDVTLLKQLGERLMNDLSVTDKEGNPLEKLSISEDGTERYVLVPEIRMWIDIEE